MSLYDQCSSQNIEILLNICILEKKEIYIYSYIIKYSVIFQCNISQNYNISKVDLSRIFYYFFFMMHTCALSYSQN